MTVEKETSLLIYMTVFFYLKYIFLFSSQTQCLWYNSVDYYLAARLYKCARDGTSREEKNRLSRKPKEQQAKENTRFRSKTLSLYVLGWFTTLSPLWNALASNPFFSFPQVIPSPRADWLFPMPTRSSFYFSEVPTTTPKIHHVDDRKKQTRPNSFVDREE